MKTADVTAAASVRKSRLTALLLASCAFVAHDAFAQVAPSTVLPERVEQRVHPTEPTQAPPAIIPPTEAPLAPVSGKLAESFTLRNVDIQDSTVYPRGTFDSIFAGRIGQTISLLEAR